MQQVQQTLNSLSYTEITEEISITVSPQYIESTMLDDEESLLPLAVAEEGYAFAYTVTIKNSGQDTVQLLMRHWIVNSGGAPYEEVEGEGVVGVQPVLTPDEEFEYTSWCIIKDPVGSMHGSYTFSKDDGEQIVVRIPNFDLVNPESLH